MCFYSLLTPGSPSEYSWISDSKTLELRINCDYCTPVLLIALLKRCL